MRLIDADDLKRELCLNCDGYCDICGEKAEKCLTCDSDRRCDFAEAIDDATTIDAVPVVHGHWEDIWDGEISSKAICSNCLKVSKRPVGQFCRWCGADMRGEDR